MISDRSRKALSGVHPDLVRVVEKADELGARFTVVCGLRTKDEQELLVKAGKSKTLKSRHLTGHAVDLVDEHFTWSEREMERIAEVVKRAAADLRIPIEWGGDWKSFIDTPHFQLPAAQYPDGEVFEAAPAVETVASAPPAPNPLHKSGTVWGVGVGLLETATGSIERGLGILTEAATKFNDLQPVHGMLAQVGANAKAVSLGLISAALMYAVSRRVKASEEGKAG